MGKKRGREEREVKVRKKWEGILGVGSLPLMD